MPTLYPIVNEKDEIIGEMDKKEAYAKSQMLRSSVILVFNDKNELFLQKRAANKDRYPSYYCASAAGHVEPGESYEEAAKRELLEELGIEAELVFLTKERLPVGPDQFAISAVYSCISDGPTELQKEEVESGDFFSLEQIRQMIDDGEKFTPNIFFLLETRLLK